MGEREVSRADRHKYKTAAWLRERGYVVEYLERYQYRFVPGKGMVCVGKYDVLGADGIAVSSGECVLWNSITGTEHMLRAVRKFQMFPNPDDKVKRLVIVWVKGESEPMLEDVSDYEPCA